jgi:chaperonin GroEL
MLGTARKVIVTKDDTTIIEGAGNISEVNARVKQIAEQAKQASSEYDKENLDKRRAALGGKVAVIKVGGATETEIEEKKFRVDDAVHAVKAALDEGVVPGGGVTQIDLSKEIKADNNSSIAAGAQLLKSALLQPFKQLMENAGLNADALLPQVEKAKNGMGVDVNGKGNVVDIKKAGIIDSTRVTREAIQNAVSIAATAMTMGALVVDIPEDQSSPAPGGSMGGGGMMGM